MSFYSGFSLRFSVWFKICNISQQQHDYRTVLSSLVICAVDPDLSGDPLERPTLMPPEKIVWCSCKYLEFFLLMIHVYSYVYHCLWVFNIIWMVPVHQSQFTQLKTPDGAAVKVNSLEERIWNLQPKEISASITLFCVKHSQVFFNIWSGCGLIQSNLKLCLYSFLSWLMGGDADQVEGGSFCRQAAIYDSPHHQEQTGFY